MAGEYDREAVLEAQVQQLQQKLMENASSQVRLRHLRDAQDREKEEWRVRQKLLEKQLATARKECRKLKRDVQDSNHGTREGSPSEEPPPTGILHRSLSSQSLPAHLSNKDRERQASPTPSLSNYPLYSQLRPTLGSYGGIPLANSTLTGQSHLSGSNSSLSSIKSTNSAVSQDRGSHTYLRNKLVPDHSARYLRSHFPFSSTPRYVAPQLSSSHSDVSATGHSNGYTSRTLLSANRDYLSSSKPTGQGEEAISPVFSKAHSGSSIDRTLTSPEVELHRSKLKIKQLQKEVSLVNEQLSDKTSSGQNHVEELVLLRTELAQEKASLAIVQQELRDQAAREVGVVRAAHTRKVKELEAELKKKNAEKGRLDFQAQELRAKVKSSESECWRLREQVDQLETQLREEKETHVRATKHLRAEVDGGCNHVAQLEGALQQCKVELAGHMSRMEEDSTHHTTQIWQMKSQVERMGEELHHKDAELARRVKKESRLQKELEDVRTERKHDHTSWQKAKKELKEQLLASEVAKESLLKQLAEVSRKLTLSSVRAEGEREVRADMETCHSEIQRLEGVVRREIEERRELEAEAGRWRTERDRMERRCKEALTKEEAAEQRWQEERAGKEACEQEGEELRREVGRLSEELKASQDQLQREMEGKAEKERNMEETLSHLQQELAKRAQQVLEMDRLLQSHQAETTARRLQLERTLSQRAGEVKTRTQEVEELTSRLSDQESTIAELRAHVEHAKVDQRNLFSGSQAQLLARDAKVSEVERKLEEAESAVAKATEHAQRLEEKVAEAEEGEKRSHLKCQQLEGKIQAMSKEQDTLHSKHLVEVQRLQDMHTSQLTSREEQASAHRLQLQQLAQQEQTRQEELARCRTQVASLSAELSAERKVSEESREQVATARTQANKYQAQVASLQSTVNTLQDLLEQQTMRAAPTTKLGTAPTHGLGLINGMPDTPFDNNEIDYAALPNHLKASQVYLTTPTSKPAFKATPTSSHATPTALLTPASVGRPTTPPTPKKGSIINI